MKLKQLPAWLVDDILLVVFSTSKEYQYCSVIHFQYLLIQQCEPIVQRQAWRGCSPFILLPNYLTNRKKLII